jgi:hypothetical protein
MNGELLVPEERKADAAFCYFDEVLGTSPIRSNTINMELLNLPCLDPTDLGEWFSEAEVWAVICALPPDKAPRMDGFSWPGSCRLLGSSTGRM